MDPLRPRCFPCCREYCDDKAGWDYPAIAFAGDDAGSGGEAGEWRVNETERRRRQFIRAHHPDRGGDPDEFMAGLRAFGAGQASPDLPPRVVVVRHRRWLARLVIAVARSRHRGRKPVRVR